MTIGKKFIGDNQVDGEKVQLLNTQGFMAVKSDGSELELFVLDASNNFQFTQLPRHSAAPSSAEHFANKAYVDAQVAAVVNSAPAVLDTLRELAAAIGDDASFATTMATSLSDMSTALNASIAAEQVARSAADSTLTTNLNAEISARGAAVTAEASARSTADSTEATVRSAADAALDAAISAEAASRAAADTALTADLDAEITARGAAVTAEASSRSSADTALGTRIDSEATSRASADTTLQANLDSETASRSAADSTEQTARIAGDTALTTGLNSEIARAGAEELRLSGLISSETLARISGDSDLDSRIDLIEGGMVAGVVWKSSLANITALNALVEGSVQPGWAYYVQDEGDVYIVVADSAGDHRPSGWVSNGFIKVADFTEISGLVTTERSRAMASEASLSSSLSSEISNRQADVDAEEVRARAAEVALSAAVSAEATRAGGAETTLQANVDAEATRALGQEAAIRSELATEASSRASADSAESAARIAADSATNSALTSESSRAAAAEGVIATNLTAEGVTRSDADSALQAVIDALVFSTFVVGSKASYTLSALQIAAGIISLGETAVANTVHFGSGRVVFVEDTDYNVVNAGGVTSVRFAGPLASGGVEALVEGDVVSVKYMHAAR
ncbi:MAG: hypothetical protein EXQ69_04310 [Acidimicrobiia bacterium]|nr:hypothetical protein [Acidimicrobiia bacterium]